MTLEEIGYVKKAYDLCCEKYDGKRMRSGRPMVQHVLEVAKICYSEMGMHSKTIVCAILHNITKVTDVTFDDIKEQFGERVSLILKGLSNVMALDMSLISSQSDTFRKLFLSMIDDIRVVMLIIAHCLYNCRNKPHHRIKGSRAIFPGGNNVVFHIGYISAARRLPFVRHGVWSRDRYPTGHVQG